MGARARGAVGKEARPTLGDVLDEAREDKTQIVTRLETVPESAGDESGHAGAETGFLAFRRDAQVDVVFQPVVGVDVPVAEVSVAVLREFDARGFDVGQAVPAWAAGTGVDAFVADAGKDAGAFGQGPDAVVFHARDEAHHVKVEDAHGEAVGGEGVAEDDAGVEVFR